MSSKFRNSVAILAIVTGLGGAALAQTATTDAPAQPAAPVTVTVDTLPEVLKSLDLQDIDIDQERRHTEVEGRLADGTQIEAKLDRDGALRMITADDDAALPAAVIDAMVPQAVRSSDIYAQFSTVEGIGVAPADSRMGAGVMIMGVNADGEKLRAGFAEDGTLIRFGSGDDMRGMGRGGDDHGERGKHGKRGDHGKHGKRGGDAEHGDRMGQRPAPLDEAAVATILTDGGYSDLGAVTQDGPRTIVEAVNANGENVTVEISPRGEVIRETAR